MQPKKLGRWERGREEGRETAEANDGGQQRAPVHQVMQRLGRVPAGTPTAGQTNPKQAKAGGKAGQTRFQSIQQVDQVDPWIVTTCEVETPDLHSRQASGANGQAAGPFQGPLAPHKSFRTELGGHYERSQNRTEVVDFMMRPLKAMHLLLVASSY